MNKVRADRRTSQRSRTRKDLLVAAARLLKDGRSPRMEDVADAALVSRATAYRYFPTLEALLVEAPLQGEVLDPENLFSDEASADPEQRIDEANAALHQMTYRNAAQLRLMLASSLTPTHKGKPAVPKPLDRRSLLIDSALSPVRDRLNTETYDRLCHALALILGTESMVVCTDLLRLDEDAARDVTSWAARVLVRAALAEASRPAESSPGDGAPNA